MFVDSSVNVLLSEKLIEIISELRNHTTHVRLKVCVAI